MAIAFVSSARPNMADAELERRFTHLVAQATIMAAHKGCSVHLITGVFDGEPEDSIAIVGDVVAVEELAAILYRRYQQDAYAVYDAFTNTGRIVFKSGEVYTSKEVVFSRTIQDIDGDYSFLPFLNTYMQMKF